MGGVVGCYANGRKGLFEQLKVGRHAYGGAFGQEEGIFPVPCQPVFHEPPYFGVYRDNAVFPGFGFKPSPECTCLQVYVAGWH